MLSSLLSVGLFALGVATSSLPQSNATISQTDVRNYFTQAHALQYANESLETNHAQVGKKNIRVVGWDLTNNLSYSRYYDDTNITSLDLVIYDVPSSVSYYSVEYFDVYDKSPGVLHCNSYFYIMMMNPGYWVSTLGNGVTTLFNPQIELMNNIVDYQDENFTGNFGILTSSTYDGGFRFNHSEPYITSEAVYSASTPYTLDNISNAYVFTPLLDDATRIFVIGLIFNSVFDSGTYFDFLTSGPDEVSDTASSLYYCKLDDLLNLANVDTSIFYDNGYKDGYNTGYSQGEENGYDAGYDAGYDDGTGGFSRSYSFWELFAAVGDTPIVMVKNLFGFDIFGVSALAVVLSIFTALVLFYIIRKLMK